MNSEGQAFSVFKLLIAAIVAIAILAILLPLLIGIGPTFQTKPTDEAVRQIKVLYTSPNEHVLSSPVTFSSGQGLNVETVAQASNVLGKGQICLSKGDYKDSTEFKMIQVENKNAIIRYDGSGSKQVRLSILCDQSRDITGDITNWGLSIDTTGCACGADAGGTETCCLIALRYLQG